MPRLGPSPRRPSDVPLHAPARRTRPFSNGLEESCPPVRFGRLFYLPGLSNTAQLRAPWWLLPFGGDERRPAADAECGPESTPEFVRQGKYPALLTAFASIDASQEATSSCTTGHRAVLGTKGNRARRRGRGGRRLGWCVAADSQCVLAVVGRFAVAGVSRNAIPTPGRVFKYAQKKAARCFY